MDLNEFIDKDYKPNPMPVADIKDNIEILIKTCYENGTKTNEP